MIAWLKSLFGTQERWSINCGYHNWTTHHLTVNEARAVLATLRDNEKASVLVWRSGWTTWRDLRDPEAGHLLVPREAAAPAALPALPTDDNYDPEITAVRPMKETRASFLSRKHIRFDANYPVIIVTATQEYTTETVDLSEGGLRLRDPLPDWVGGYCNVIIQVEDGQQLEVMCSLAEDQAHEKTRLEMAPSEKHTEYLNWFTNHPKYRAHG